MLKKKNIIIFVIIMVGILTIHFTQSKYVVNVQEQYAEPAEKFYFESDILENSNYELTDWDGISTYVIDNIDLSKIEDVIRYGNSNVEYEVETLVENALAVLKINGQEATNGTITEKNIDTLTLEATPIISNEQMNITLIVRSTSPYKKEIEATFNIIPKNDFEEYKTELIDSSGKNDPVLYIQNNDTEKTFKIQYDNAKVSLDISNNLQYGEIITNNNISYIQITASANTVEMVKFIKKESYIGNILELEKDIIIEAGS